MKKIFTLIIILLSFGLLFAENQIPFYFDEQGAIYIKANSENGKELNLFFDTGNSTSIIFSSGITKYFEKSVEDFLFDMLRNYNPDATDEELMAYVPTVKEEKSFFLHFDDEFYTGNKLLNNLSFRYSYNEYNRIEADGFDGIVNLKALNIDKNIIIDYVNNQIIIDGEFIEGSVLPMKKLEIADIYYIDIKINGIKQPAAIDTGSLFLMLRPEYKSSKYYKENEIFNMSEESLNSMFMKEDKEKSVRLKIGDFSEKVTGHFFTLEKYKIQTGAGTKAVIAAYNILGNDIFKNHIIQMDFENMEFRIK